MTSEMSNGNVSLRAQALVNRVRGYWNGVSKARRMQVVAAGQGLAVIAALVGVGAGSVAGMHALAARLPDNTVSPAVAMTVGQGETLWNIAARYGNPSESQLDRLDTLAKANGLSASATLHPGQRLVVPVANPQEANRLQTALAVR